MDALNFWCLVHEEVFKPYQSDWSQMDYNLSNILFDMVPHENPQQILKRICHPTSYKDLITFTALRRCLSVLGMLRSCCSCAYRYLYLFFKMSSKSWIPVTHTSLRLREVRFQMFPSFSVSRVYLIHPTP